MTIIVCPFIGLSLYMLTTLGIIISCCQALLVRTSIPDTLSESY